MQDEALFFSNLPDKDYFVRETIALENGNYTLSVQECTVASPDKPNEDAFSLVKKVAQLYIGVFDGTSSLKPISALDPITGARFASHYIRDQFADAVKSSSTPREVMISLNNTLLTRSLELGGKLEDTHTLPSSTGTIVAITPGKNSLSVAHVGDSYCLVYYTDGRSEQITNDLNKKFDQEMYQIGEKLAKEHGIVFRETRKLPEMNDALIDMFNRRNNNPNGKGSGLINGDPNMEQYIFEFSQSLDGVSSILIGTDGLLPAGWSSETHEERMKLLREIEKGGLEHLIKTKKDAEDNDPDWNHHRYKHSDDATGVFIRLNTK